MHQELDQTTGDASLDNGLDLVIWTIREVGNSPTSINKHFVIKHVDELGQNWKSWCNLQKS